MVYWRNCNIIIIHLSTSPTYRCHCTLGNMNCTIVTFTNISYTLLLHALNIHTIIVRPPSVFRKKVILQYHEQDLSELNIICDRKDHEASAYQSCLESSVLVENHLHGCYRNYSIIAQQPTLVYRASSTVEFLPIVFTDNWRSLKHFITMQDITPSQVIRVLNWHLIQIIMPLMVSYLTGLRWELTPVTTRDKCDHLRANKLGSFRLQ